MTVSNASVPGQGTLPRLIYLTTEYPHISHTFIRREIRGLEDLGYTIQRVAINAGETILEGDDRAEAELTLHILDQGWWRILTQAFIGIRHAGFRFVKAAGEMFSLSRASDRGLLRHLAYLCEALVLLTTAKAQATDHVHVHFGTNAATVAYLARLMGGPRFSMTVHGPVEFDQPYGQSLTKKLSAASFTVAISSFCKSQLFRWAPLAAWPNIHIVGCSVGSEWFDAARSIDESSNGLVSVGRLDEQKGQLLLVDAFADAVAAGFDERLIIVGDGPFRAAIEARITARSMAERVELVGWRSAAEIREYLLAAKALVVASFAEGLPVVIMEAMAVGRPILTTRINGIPELVRDSTDGWLVTPGDCQELTSAMLRLGETDVERLDEMGRCAQERVRSRHFTADVVKKLDNVLRLHHEAANTTDVTCIR